MKVATVREIVEKYHGQHMSMRDLARAYKLNRREISRILRGTGIDPRDLVKTGAYVPQPAGLLEQNLGHQFRKVRQEKGIGLHKFARLMARGINVIRWHETGARMMRLDDIVRAAALLKVEPGELCKQETEAQEEQL
jgi:transcriptional regulator with XRE-family HTH domain